MDLEHSSFLESLRRTDDAFHLHFHLSSGGHDDDRTFESLSSGRVARWRRNQRSCDLALDLGLHYSHLHRRLVLVGALVAARVRFLIFSSVDFLLDDGGDGVNLDLGRGGGLSRLGRHRSHVLKRVQSKPAKSTFFRTQIQLYFLSPFRNRHQFARRA